MEEHYNELGQLHRLDGPAFLDIRGGKYWCQNGVLHRLDGPAVELTIEPSRWFINGKNITPEVNAWLREQNIKLPLDPPSLTLFLLTFNLDTSKS
jgi:hypothetical protein